MNTRRAGLLLCVAAVMFLPRAAAAQEWDEPWSDPRDRPPRVDLSVSAGVLAPTDWSDAVVLGSISPISGVLEQVLVRDLQVEPDRIFGAAVTYWRDRYGFRVHGARSQSTLTIGGAPLGAGESPQDLLPTDIDTWFYEVRGAIGLVEYSPDRNLWPYVFAGFGALTYDLDRTISPPLLAFIERGGTLQQGPGDVVVVEDDGRAFLLAIDELGTETVFALNFGIGTDVRLPFGGGGVGLRFEVSDHMAPSPLEVRIRELTPSGGLDSDATVDFGIVHHLRAGVGLVVQIGR